MKVSNLKPGFYHSEYMLDRSLVRVEVVVKQDQTCHVCQDANYHTLVYENATLCDAEDILPEGLKYRECAPVDFGKVFFPGQKRTEATPVSSLSDGAHELRFGEPEGCEYVYVFIAKNANGKVDLDVEWRSDHSLSVRYFGIAQEDADAIVEEAESDLSRLHAEATANDTRGRIEGSVDVAF